MATTLFATTWTRLVGALLLLTGLAGIASLAAGFIGFLSRDFLVWDGTHNLLHLVLGAVALYVGFARRPALGVLTYNKVFGVVYTLLALIGFSAGGALGFLGVGLESGENLIHLVIGAGSIVAGFYVVQGGAAGTPQAAWR